MQLDRPLKVVADAGNGVAGALAPQLLEAIGADVIPLYCDVDGTFPNHHPDPSEPANLEDLVQTVKRFGADLGVAFDGDGDRLGVVTGEGRIIYADRLLMLFAADVLMRNPGAMVIYDVKCTGKLSDHVLRNGGSPLMWKTGHSLMKAKMRETDAELAGEMSGHFFFKERWFGFDDGLYAAARLLEILAQREETPDEVLGELPEMVATPELKVPVAEGTPHALVAMLVAAAHRRTTRTWAAACRPSTACAWTSPMAGAWCVPPTPPRCWCCVSRATTRRHWSASRPCSAASCNRCWAIPRWGSDPFGCCSRMGSAGRWPASQCRPAAGTT